jgi:hypothetical protein
MKIKVGKKIVGFKVTPDDESEYIIDIFIGKPLTITNIYEGIVNCYSEEFKTNVMYSLEDVEKITSNPSYKQEQIKIANKLKDNKFKSGTLIKGFKFGGNRYYDPRMDDYIDVIGVIQVCLSKDIRVSFKDGVTWSYPKYEAEKHLIKEYIPGFFD